MTSNNQPEHRYRYHRASGKPRSLRTKVSQHIAALSVVFVYFLLSVWKESGAGGTTSDWSVVLYLLFAALLYGATYAMYPMLRRAWVDSKK